MLLMETDVHFVREAVERGGPLSGASLPSCGAMLKSQQSFSRGQMFFSTLPHRNSLRSQSHRRRGRIHLLLSENNKDTLLVCMQIQALHT